MSKYIIDGGKPLKGEISIRGAKNASFKQIIASLLSEESTHLLNIPDISDVHITESIAKSLGAKITPTGPHSIEINPQNINHSIIPTGTGEKSRSSFMFAAPLLARTGEAVIPIPGGDKLGARPLDRLFDCYRQMSIEVKESERTIHFKSKQIKATNFTFPKPSHTVTEVIIMTCALARGESTINNAALEPEIDDLIDMLNSMGGKIKRDPNNPKTIYIKGVPFLNGTQHQVIADRNETVTFACAALCTKGSINILRINPQIVDTFLRIIQQMGAKIFRGTDEVQISWQGGLKAIDVETEPEPGFMTDWQAVFSLVLTQAVGVSSIIERIFPFRFQHFNTLQKMGAKINFFNPSVKDFDSYYHFNKESDKPEYFHGAKIYGPCRLKPIDIKIDDLRAGATATLAALTAEGRSTIDGVQYIERGYELLADRLQSLGAAIQYIKT